MPKNPPSPRSGRPRAPSPRRRWRPPPNCCPPRPRIKTRKGPAGSGRSAGRNAGRNGQSGPIFFGPPRPWPSPTRRETPPEAKRSGSSAPRSRRGSWGPSLRSGKDRRRPAEKLKSAPAPSAWPALRLMSRSSMISPNSSSRRSSRVTKPAVFPYSSTTIARWILRF